MKTKAKKIILGLGLALLGSFATKAQGLQNIIVEKYYKADANDVSNATSNGATAPLTTNHVTYRVFVDMAPGYQLNAVYGTPLHPWKFTTSTSFFNDPQFGSIVGVTTSTTNVRKATAMLDSYLTMGGAANGKQGVLKTADPDGSIGNFNGILANNPGGVFGLPITGSGSADGLATGTVQAATGVGFTNQTDVFDQTPGNSFSVTAQSVAALGGAVGTTSTNVVFIGQFTTDGEFGFELNLQVQLTGSLTAENWVANNPQSGEFTLGALTLAPPTVSITAPANGSNVITGNVVAIAANAASAGGTITSVDFRVDGISVGTDVTAPYTASYLATNGTHTITAIATDNNSLTATSSNVIIIAAANQAPLVTVSAPAGPIVAPGVVTFSANAIDLDGTVSSLTLFVNGGAIGTSTNAGPAYTFTWTSIAGLNQNVTASATDNLGAVGSSSAVVFNVTANTPPNVVINTPLNNSSVLAPQVVTITATATDPGGSITLVEAFVNNVSIGSYTTAGPNYTWTYATSTLTTLDIIKVVATDNGAATTTSSPVSVNIGNPNGNPYQIGAVQQQCNQSNFCLPIKAGISYTSATNVIGYDFILTYNPAKVTPSGLVTVLNYINPLYVQIAEDHTTTPGTMYVSASLAGNTPTNVVWNLTVGGGTLFCVDFNKISANFAAVETTTFGISSMQESYFTGVSNRITDPGSYTSYRDTLFDGSLKFWADASAMGYTNSAVGLITNVYGTSTLCVPTNTTISVQPSAAGGFTYNILNGDNINITRDINNNTSVQLAINAGDQTIARNVLLNLATGTLQPNVYQMIALDVNLDGQITSGDLTQINQRAIDFIGEYKQAWNYNAAGTKTLTGFGSESKDWIFVDTNRVTTSAYQISNSWPFAGTNGGFYKGSVPSTPFCLSVPQSSNGSCPTIFNETFVGIMLGDATGNFSVLSSTLQLRPTSDRVVIDLEKSIMNGNTIEVPVSFVSSKPVYGLDFAMKFDESSLTYNTMVNYPTSTDALAYFNPNSKFLRFTCTNVNSNILPAGQPVASIRFETKNGQISPDQFNSLLGILNGEQVAVEVLSRTVGINALGSDNAVSIFPNPTNGILNITSISDATVQLFDVTGKEVLLQTSVNASKTQQINVSGLVNGVYILKVSNNDFVTIKKVVLNK